MFVFANTVIFEGSAHPGRPRQPWNCESAAGRASSRTTVPAGKKAVHVPVPPTPLMMMQLMPGGWDVTVPLPLPPGMMLMLPVGWDEGVAVGAGVGDGPLGVHPASVACADVVPSLTVI